MALDKSKVQWDPRLKYKFDLNIDAIYTLRGPRQVGKTTLIKDMIRHLIKSQVPPRNIFYYTCDLIDNPKALVETISSYLTFARPSPKRRVYLMLDEVSSIKDWQKAIKHLADTGKLIQTTLILTGSPHARHQKSIRKATGTTRTRQRHTRQNNASNEIRRIRRDPEQRREGFYPRAGNASMDSKKTTLPFPLKRQYSRRD